MDTFLHKVELKSDVMSKSFFDFWQPSKEEQITFSFSTPSALLTNII